ncbi:protein kinase [Pseudomonas edaphica]|uniref:non-specific serine/threonine protein kinase n=1 Tax=Pseudomonas edaphica TaxID=2006980 RepID=A0A7Y8BE80_9PSED|nr:protein kinase [Pseudomonas sp. IPO3747]NWE06422.1 protein kinase [Pseudomonas edaphica]NWE83259.1 protein kinase [Pseudomonas edaphica]
MLPHKNCGEQMQELTVLDTPATRLQGMELSDGWIVEELIACGRGGTHADCSGGTYSVAYRVRKGNSVAFLKALDLDSVITDDGDDDFVDSINRATQAFGDERQLNELCAKSRMRQVVTILGHGTVKVDRKPEDHVPRVAYLILELADGGDVRSHITQTSNTDYAKKFSYLKDVLLGIGQLHNEEISHQDLKPSNVMVFSQFGAKVGDLGRATIKGYGRGAFEQDSIAGDYGYAPPEQLYGHVPTEWIDRRQRADLYQFGSLVCFLVLGFTVNALIKERLPAAVGPKHWFPDQAGGSSYTQALPYLESAFYEGLQDCKMTLPAWAADKVVSLISQCSNPDYSKRGAKQLLGNAGLGLGLNRFISALENLRTEAKKQAILEGRRQSI